MEKTFDELVRDYERLKAIHDCGNIMGKMSYYSTTFMTKEIVDLWADRDDCTLEMPYGCYDGIDGVRRFYLEVMGDRSEDEVLEKIKGVMCTSLYENQVITVAEDRQTARGIWYSPGVETYGRSAKFDEFIGKSFWNWSKTAADFIFEDGEWKLWHMTVFILFRSDYYRMWTKETGEYKGFVLGDPRIDREPHVKFTKYNIEEVLNNKPEYPKPYNTFADVAPGYGYAI